MSYGVIYRHEFTDEYDRRKRADVLKKDYTGDITEKTGATHSPLHISIQSQGDDKYTTIKPTEIELKIFSDNFEFEAITEAADKDYQIRVYEAPTEEGDLVLKHIGYVIPEIYSEPYVVEPYPASIRAASMGILNAERYVTDTYGEFFTGTATLMTVITRCLNKLGYEIDIWDSTNTFEDRITYHDDSPFKTIKVNQDAFVVEEKGREQALTCMEVLERVLKPFAVNFFMDFGRWVIIPIELRATQREVRIYDYQGTYQETGNYNPLAQTFNFLNQDQSLEFMPVIRDVESVYEHGLPNDAIVDPSFSEDFTIESVTDDTIQVPAEWDVNDLSDFTAFGFLMGCRLVAAPNDQSGPQAVCLDSDFMEDGAYIEFQGTKFLDFQTGDAFLFSLSYAGAAYERNSDDNDQNYIQPTKDNELTIDHKVQVKIGSYYLTAEGEWTQTPTDIVITDLGDATSGASTLENRDLGIASGFRVFEIATEEVPEDGVAYARIYKPTSENEGQFTGDSIAKVAYSLFSMTVYPEGEPPEEATTFFSERDITSYAEEVNYDVHLGDGPTNLHDSSFLITDSGNDLMTASWTRGSFSGGIEDVYINAIFLEYESKSNLIRGTQKVKGLFDRWFIDYSKGYTVLAGTYDERMCTFNGEMVEILNSEADIWGDPLEAPENFRVFEASEPPTIFSDRFYRLKEDGTDEPGLTLLSFDDSYSVFEPSGGGLTVEKEYTGATIAELRAGWQQGGDIIILRNGNVCVYGEVDQTGTGVLYMFDSDLNLLDSDTFTLSSDSGSVTVDEEDNVYVVSGDEIANIIKYSTSGNTLTKEYTSDDLTASTSSPNSVDHACLATTTEVILVIRSRGKNDDDDTVYRMDVFSIDRETGEKTDKFYQTTFESFNNRTPDVSILSEDSFIISFVSIGYWILDFSLGLKDTISYSSLGLSPNGNANWNSVEALLSGNFVWNGQFDAQVRHINPDGTLVSTGGDSADSRKLDIIGDQYTITQHDYSSSTRGVMIYDPANDTNKAKLTWSQSDSLFRIASAPENWQLEAFGVDTGTPTITNVVLSADPSTATVPFTSTITFGADNTGDADVTLICYQSIVDRYTIGGEVGRVTIPAGGSASESVDVTFSEVGVYTVFFAGLGIPVTANGEDTDPNLTNIVLSATPTEGTVPFDTTITFGADNTGGSPVTAGLYIQSEKVDEITIPAGGTNSDTFTHPVTEEGTIGIYFEGEHVEVTGNVDANSSSGYIDIESAATDDTEEVQPDGTVDVIHTPSQQSDECGTGGTEFNVEWKLTDYCMILPDGPDKETVAQAVSGSISSKVTGLGSTYPGLSPSGYPRIRVYSETAGTADNGESVTFGVPSQLEQDGGVFSRYTVNLTGGVDEYIVSEEIDILIGGSVFATTAAIDNLETANSIAQKIYDACVAVGSGTYSFSKNGTRISVGSTGGSETLDLDIKNAGFEYTVEDIS